MTQADLIDLTSRQCVCDPCDLPRANGGRCPSMDTVYETRTGGLVHASHCIPCAFCSPNDELVVESITGAVPDDGG